MQNSSVTVHPLTDNPTEAWRAIFKTQKTIKVNVKQPSKPVENNKIRFVCMSDTHSLIHNIKFDIPEGDVFIHAGDFSKCGQKDEVITFNKWLGNLPHKHKIVIAGNHELSFDRSLSNMFEKKFCNSRHTGVGIDIDIVNYAEDSDTIENAIKTVNVEEYLTNCTYLQDAFVTLYGIKIYGTPWQPTFGGWAFNLDRGTACLSKWDLIPDDTDVLITHTPPLGHGDLACFGVRAGCTELLTTVQQRVKPKYHIFGHIHEGYGVTSDGKIIFINASTCDINYMPNNVPIVFDMPIPPGFSK